jgi:CO/xanthine dehydrogenase FAD-binding subunit
MSIVEHQTPSSLSEAYQLLQSNPDNMIIGGGAWMKLSHPKVNVMISLEQLGLNQIQETSIGVTIGAKVTLRELETSPILLALADGVLSQAARSIASVQLRNIATIGGSIYGRFGFSDVLTALMVLDPVLEFYHTEAMTLNEFLTLKKPPRDILVKIIIPKSSRVARFKKVATTALDFPIVNLAVARENEQFSICVGCRPQIAALAKKAMHEASNGLTHTRESLSRVVELAVEELHFSDNFRSSKAYRQQLVKIHLERLLLEVTPIEN